MSLEEATDPVRTISYGILKPGPDVAGGVPYVRVVNFRNDVLDAHGLRRTTSAIAAKYARAALEPHDVLVSIRGTYGRVVVVPQALRGANITQDTARLAFLSLINPRFAAIMLRSPFTQTYMKRVARGVAVKGVNIADLRAMPFPLPSPDEQQQVVDIVEDHMSRLDAATETVGGVRRRLARWQKSWRDNVVWANASSTGTLGDLVERIEAGKSFGGSAPAARDGQWGVIKVSAMTWGRFRPEENKAVSGDRVDPRYQIRSGDVLVSRANTTEYVGAPVLVGATPTKLLLSDKSLRLVPRRGVDPRWLVQVLASPTTRRQISQRATGTKDSMRNISQTALLAVTVPVATPQEQDRVITLTESIDGVTTTTRSALDAAETRSVYLRRALLEAASDGRLITSRVGYLVKEVARV